MLQLYMIALVGMVVVRESLPGGSAAGGGSGAEFSWWMVAGAMAPFVAIVLVVDVVCRGCARRLDRAGTGEDVLRAESALERGRFLAVIAHGLAVFVFGWVDQVRAAVGDVVAFDELIAILPAALTMIAGWWSWYPIESKLRESVIVRKLDDGVPVYATPGRGAFVWGHVRHEMLLILLPLMLVMAWGEGMERVISWAMERKGEGGWVGAVGSWLSRGHGETGALVRTGMQVVGVVAVFTIAPLLLRMVWDTVRLGPGPMRDELLGLCRRAGVNVREVLVWRTHGMMINGAAMGVVPAIRYILLTDALLERLPEREVHAVMAHEVAHVKHRHIAWLIAAMFATAGVVGTGMSVALAGVDRVALRTIGIDVERLEREAAGHEAGVRSAIDPELARKWEVWLMASEAGGALVSLGAMFAVFGWISRRFEWQADAFAVKQLSADAESDVVTAEATAAMAGALRTVARLNHIPMARKSFRHGSIRTRIEKLEALVGRPVRGLRADVVARRIKWCAAAGVGLVVGLTVWGIVSVGEESRAGVSSGHVSVGEHREREQEIRR